MTSKIIVDSDYIHKIKRHLLLEKITMKNLGSVLKSRDITLLTNVLIVKAMVFQVVIYACESWTIKKAEHWRTDVFEMWCWRRLLRVSWTARRSNQLILKKINPKYSLEGLMLKLKLQKEENGATDDETVGWHHWLNRHEFEQTLKDSEGQGSLMCCNPWGSKESNMSEQLNNKKTNI